MTPGSDHRRGRNVVSAPQAHLVFTTKYRQAVLDDAMPTHCEQIIRNVCVDFSAELAEFNGEDNHVHLLATRPPKVTISALANALKGVSARRLRAEFTRR
jgi:putative transposase